MHTTTVCMPYHTTTVPCNHTTRSTSFHRRVVFPRPSNPRHAAAQTQHRTHRVVTCAAAQPSSLVSSVFVDIRTRWGAWNVATKFEQAIKRQIKPSSLLSIMKMVFCSIAGPLSIYLPCAAAMGALQHVNKALALVLERIHIPNTAAAAAAGGLSMELVIEAAMQGGFLSALGVMAWECHALLQLVVHRMPQFMQVAFIAFGVSATMQFKRQLVEVVLVRTRNRSNGNSSSGNGNTGGGDVQQDASKFTQALLPLSGLISWGVAVSGALMALSVLGCNVQPLLAVGGVGGIVLGWSAQSIFGNALSGITLFITQPFVVGERVALRDASGPLVRGYVESIAPMFTSIRGDDLMLVAVPNKTVASSVITNESRIAMTMVESQYNEPRQLQLELSLDIGNAARLGSILGQINSHLNNDAAVHKELPFGASVVGLTAEHVKLLVVAHTTVEYANKFSMFQTRLSIDMLEILNGHPLSTGTHAGQLAPSSVAPLASPATASR